MEEHPDEAFPRHGWILGSSGVRLLRLPVLRIFQGVEPMFGDLYRRNSLAGVWLQSRSPYMSLRQLSIALRDLHAETRLLVELAEQEWIHREPSGERDAAMTREQEGRERVEVLLIAIFVLLRRLADQLIDASRPILFEQWQSAPRHLKTAIAMAERDSLAALGPRCDLATFTEALRQHTEWFEQLRQDEGIRDILVHKDHILLVSGQGTRMPTDERTTWRVSAHLTRWRKDGLRTVELFDVLRGAVRGACDFMEQLCRAVGLPGGYGRADLMFLTGHDLDIVGFWPAVSRGAVSF